MTHYDVITHAWHNVDIHDEYIPAKQLGIPRIRKWDSDLIVVELIAPPFIQPTCSGIQYMQDPLFNSIPCMFHYREIYLHVTIIKLTVKHIATHEISIIHLGVNH